MHFEMLRYQLYSLHAIYNVSTLENVKTLDIPIYIL